MLTATSIPSSERVSTGRQRSIRRHVRKLSLKSAVRLAVDVSFRFKFRAIRGPALWSESERVWLGRETFFYWSTSAADIDIPWAVATADGAPRDAEQLRHAVHSELASYWADRLASLPRRGCPQWLPLP
jgi:hypothetical protein